MSPQKWPKNPTVRKMFEYYLQYQQMQEKTKKQYGVIFRKMEETGFADKTLKQLDRAGVKYFLLSWELGDSSRYVYYNKVSAIISTYIQDHNISTNLNLSGLLKRPATKQDHDGEKFLTIAEFIPFMKFDLSDRDVMNYGRDVLALMTLTGMAVVDAKKFEPSTHVTQDGKWVRYIRQKTKKNQKLCEIPMTESLQQIIDRNKWPIKISARRLNYIFEDLSKVAGKDITTHTGRHSFGVIMLELGFSMEAVSKMMGHSSISVTEQIYAKVTVHKIQREMDKMTQRIDSVLNF